MKFPRVSSTLLNITFSVKVLQFLFGFVFWRAACGILVPDQGWNWHPFFGSMECQSLHCQGSPSMLSFKLTNLSQRKGYFPHIFLYPAYIKNTVKKNHCKWTCTFKNLSWHILPLVSKGFSYSRGLQPLESNAWWSEVGLM